MSILDPSKRERRGLIMLMLALIILMLGGVLLLTQSNRSDWRSGMSDSAGADTSGVALPKSTENYYAVPEVEFETFPFDPNTADSTMLLRLGFPPYMVHNIYKYRAHGGRYHIPEDLSRLYGMTGELWERISPYIRIAEKYQFMEPKQTAERHERVERDSTRTYYSNKLREGETIGLNNSDTTQLQKIPGIGPYYAKVIAKYRDQLGGFVSLSQLDEIEELPEDFSPWFYLDETDIRQLDVNKATQRELVRHPYLRARLAIPIMDHRRKYGPLRNLQELRRLPNFTEKDIERLTPYLKF